MGGFAAIERSEPEGLGVFRLVIGHATVECGTLPPAQWVSELIKRLSV